MVNYVLLAKTDFDRGMSDGFYTGNSYIYQGAKYAVVERDITKAKIYSSKAMAANACKVLFENYAFEVIEIQK